MLDSPEPSCWPRVLASPHPSTTSSSRIFARFFTIGGKIPEPRFCFFQRNEEDSSLLVELPEKRWLTLISILIGSTHPNLPLPISLPLSLSLSLSSRPFFSRNVKAGVESLLAFGNLGRRRKKVNNFWQLAEIQTTISADWVATSIVKRACVNR